MKNIPIIKYCHIRDLADSKSVSITEFEKQIIYLKKKKYNFLSLDEYIALKCAKEPMNEKNILLIFEGGWRDFYTNAIPILTHYWVKVGMFIATEWIDESSKQEKNIPNTILDSNLAHNDAMLILNENPRSVLCTWEELQKVKEFTSFGSMTHTYRLSNYVTKPWHEDLQLSKDLIAQNLGMHTTHLIWPRNEYDATLLRTAKKLGFNAFYINKKGLNLQDSILEQNKYIIAPNNFFQFKKKLFAYSNTLTYRLFKIFL